MAAWAIAGQTRLDSQSGFHNNAVSYSNSNSVYGLQFVCSAESEMHSKWRMGRGEIIALSRFKRCHFLLSASFVAIIMQFARSRLRLC